MNEWTAEANDAIRMCEAWAAKVVADLPCRLFLFGSAIYKSGEQFDREYSDLDIACLLSGPSTALKRFYAFKTLHVHKANLELDMIRTLSRVTCTEPGVSIVTITDFELHANIHKSGARSFFTKNFFYDLLAREETLGIPLAGTRTMKDEYRQALEYVQKIRNGYLAIAANGTGGLGEFRGVDPMPKALLRAAAQLNTDAVDGEWYDTRLGLELMFSILRDRRSDGPEFKKLFDRVSVRRGGRGLKTNLSPNDQLLLTEILFDVAATGETEEVVTWEVRLSGTPDLPNDEKALSTSIKRLVPDAQLIGTRRGSVIMRFRSSASGYNILVELQEFGILAKMLNVASARLIRVDIETFYQETGEEGREHRLLQHISNWRPQGATSWIIEENEFAEYLKEAIETDSRLMGVSMLRNVRVSRAEVSHEMDFLLSWVDPDGRQEQMGIDLWHVRTHTSFLHKISQLLSLDQPVIFVAVGNERLLAKLKPDVSRLALLNANIRVIPVQLSS